MPDRVNVQRWRKLIAEEAEYSDEYRMLYGTDTQLVPLAELAALLDVAEAARAFERPFPTDEDRERLLVALSGLEFGDTT